MNNFRVRYRQICSYFGSYLIPLTRQRELSGTGKLIIFVILMFVLWSAIFIYKSSFVLEGKRYFVLFDDAMIHMTYAKNAVAGIGLCWNHFGQPVEGITSLLWCGYMIFIHLFPIAENTISIVVQLSSMGLLLINTLVLAKIMRRYFQIKASHCLPVIVLSLFYYPLNYWALMGMEVGMVALLFSIIVYLSFKIIVDKQNCYLLLFVTYLLSFLLRMDSALIIAVSFSYIVWYRGINKKFIASIIPGATIAVLGVLALFAFRWLYYHDILPNTYYLKMTGVDPFLRIERGFRVFLSNWFWVSPIFIILTFSGALIINKQLLLLPLLIVIAYLCYSIYIGGDAWEWACIGANRFISAVMPLFFLILNLVFIRIFPKNKIGRAVMSFVLIGSCLASFNGLLSQHYKHRLALFTMSKPALHVMETKKKLRTILRIRDLLPASAKIAVQWAGITGYYAGNYQLIDLLGRNDRHVARMEVALQNWSEFYPGHNKWDLNYSIARLKPDLVMELWRIKKYFVPLADQLGYIPFGDMYIRKP